MCVTAHVQTSVPGLMAIIVTPSIEVSQKATQNAFQVMNLDSLLGVFFKQSCRKNLSAALEAIFQNYFEVMQIIK